MLGLKYKIWGKGKLFLELQMILFSSGQIQVILFNSVSTSKLKKSRILVVIDVLK